MAGRGRAEGRRRSGGGGQRLPHGRRRGRGGGGGAAPAPRPGPQRGPATLRSSGRAGTPLGKLPVRARAGGPSRSLGTAARLLTGGRVSAGRGLRALRR